MWSILKSLWVNFVFWDRRRVIATLIDLSLILWALLCSYFLVMYPDFNRSHLLPLLIIFLTHMLFFPFLGTHRGIWKLTSIPDIIHMILVFLSLGTLSFLARTVLFPERIFLRLIVVNFFIAVFYTLSVRMAIKLSYGKPQSKTRRRALVIGAGAAGQQLVRELTQSQREYLFEVIGIIDDKVSYLGRSLYGKRILGTVDDIKYISREYKIDLALIAAPSATEEQLHRIFNACYNAGLEVKTLPPLKDVINNAVSASQLRDIDLDDLLGREPVSLDLETIKREHGNRVVLVTGGAGSIGAELCKQILKFNPSKLIVLDNSEFFTYEIEKQLQQQFPNNEVVCYLGDVRNLERLRQVFREFSPAVVYHAAAYKHVPLMEKFPIEAIETNILGTKNIAEMALAHGASKFVLVSTDKAVNPTNVMGATKRVAEMICQKLNGSGSTKFSIVRFGNVLGSRGSVVPLFKEQIATGGPVTVTDPKMTRYFMSIPEACQLVVQAGCMVDQGEIFVLDMGKPINIDDLAKQLIKLSGFRVGADIKIVYTGLRPGEKLFEELFYEGEMIRKTTHESVKTLIARDLPRNFDMTLEYLLVGIKNHNPSDCIQHMWDLVREDQGSRKSNTVVDNTTSFYPTT